MGGAHAIVTVISDDGHYETCLNLDRILDAKGLKCTVAGAVCIVKPHKNDWMDILQHGRIDIVSHSYDHIRMEDGREIAEDVDALNHEIVGADKWYEDWLGKEQIAYVCPENQMCEIGYRILEENMFWAVRKGHRGFNSLSPEEGTDDGQWFSLNVQGIRDEGVDTNVRNEWVDKAISNRLWLIEMWHNVMPEDDGMYQTLLVSDAESHLDYVAKKAIINDIWVATFDEAVKYIREKQNANLVSYLIGDTLYVTLSLNSNKMSVDTFNYPLTITVELPNEYDINGEDNVEINNNILKTNIIPGETKIINLNKR